jgi:hypothetical protein
MYGYQALGSNVWVQSATVQYGELRSEIRIEVELVEIINNEVRQMSS